MKGSEHDAKNLIVMCCCLAVLGQLSMSCWETFQPARVALNEDASLAIAAGIEHERHLHCATRTMKATVNCIEVHICIL